MRLLYSSSPSKALETQAKRDSTLSSVSVESRSTDTDFSLSLVDDGLAGATKTKDETAKGARSKGRMKLSILL